MTEGARLTVYLMVYEGDAPMGGAGNLMRRIYITPFVPQPEQIIEIIPDIHHRVKRVYWNLDGSVHCELIAYHVDPTEMMQSLVDGKYRCYWDSGTDGDLVARLKEAGWMEWEQWHKSA